MYIQKHNQELYAEVQERQAIVKEIFSVEIGGLIVPIVVNDNRKVIEIQQKLLKEGLLVGAIRQPTVPSAIIRLIARLGTDADIFRERCFKISAIIQETI